jgi:hypothetical protein
MSMKLRSQELDRLAVVLFDNVSFDVRRRIARERVPTAPPAPNTERRTRNAKRRSSFFAPSGEF